MFVNYFLMHLCDDEGKMFLYHFKMLLKLNDNLRKTLT